MTKHTLILLVASALLGAGCSEKVDLDFQGWYTWTSSAVTTPANFGGSSSIQHSLSTTDDRYSFAINRKQMDYYKNGELSASYKLTSTSTQDDQTTLVFKDEDRQVIVYMEQGSDLVSTPYVPYRDASETQAMNYYVKAN